MNIAPTPLIVALAVSLLFACSESSDGASADANTNVDLSTAPSDVTSDVAPSTDGLTLSDAPVDTSPPPKDGGALADTVVDADELETESGTWVNDADTTDLWASETDTTDLWASETDTTPDGLGDMTSVDSATNEVTAGDTTITDLWGADALSDADSEDAELPLWDAMMDVIPVEEVTTDADVSVPDLVEEVTTDANDDACPVNLQQIFLITDANWLMRFEPATLALVPLGMVNCNAGGATPFSMSVDREGYAWVLYSDSTLWRVNTGDVSCQSTGFVPSQQGFDYFGMGFTSDGPNTKTETLYIAGGGIMDFSFGTGSLGTLVMPSLMVTTIAPFSLGSGSPELTGTRFGELWGFFAMATPSHVSRIDQQTAGLEKTWPLPATLQNPQSWAFAHWGGDFYLFFKGEAGFASGAWHLDGITGITSEVVPNLGHTITGAGVSTCAPAQ